MEILINSLIISLFCVGLRIVSDEGMILDFIRKPYVLLSEIQNPTLIAKISKYLLKPVIGCVKCMSSVWSLAISHFYLGGIDKWTFLIIFVVSALNTWIYKLIDND